MQIFSNFPSVPSSFLGQFWNMVLLTLSNLQCFLLCAYLGKIYVWQSSADSHQKIFDYGQILLLVTIIPSVFCIRTLLLFLYMLMLCHRRVPLITLLHQHYGNDVILGIKHMKKRCYRIFARLYFCKQGTFLDSKSMYEKKEIQLKSAHETPTHRVLLIFE